MDVSRHGITNSKHWWLYIGFLFGLSLLIWLSSSQNFRFASGSDPLQASGLLQQPEQWKNRGKSGTVEFDDGVLLMSLTDNARLRTLTTVDITHNTTHSGQLMHARVRGLFTREQGPADIKPVNKQPFLSIRALNEDGKNRKGAVIRFNNPDPLHRFDISVPLAEDVTQLRLILAINRPGTWTLSELDVSTVVESQAYLWSTRAAMVLAIALALIFTVNVIVLLKPAQVLILLGLIGLTTALIVLDQRQLDVFSSGIIERVQNFSVRYAPDTTMPVTKALAQKTGHVIFYFLLTIAFLCMYRKLRMSFLQTVAFVLALSLLTEAFQHYSFTRSPSAEDLALNTAGIGLALVLWAVVSGLINFRSSKQSQQDTPASAHQRIE